MPSYWEITPGDKVEVVLKKNTSKVQKRTYLSVHQFGPYTAAFLVFEKRKTYEHPSVIEYYTTDEIHVIRKVRS